MKKNFLIMIVLSLTHTVSNAGTLIDGIWSPTNCGEKPEPPAIDVTSPENFNRSVEAINEWQDRALAYNSCLIKEANADNDLIAKTANDTQAEFRKTIDRVSSEAEKARDKIDSK